MKIYLFRHGETYYNKNNIFTGRKNSKLTVKGKRDAERIAKKLENKKIDVAIHTSLSRSKETLKIILKHHPECKKIITDDRMIEGSYGSLSRKKYNTIIKKYGIEQYNLWLGNYYIRPPKGENFADIEKRVKKFITWLIKYIEKDKINIAISAHGNSIRMFRKIMENLSIEETQKLKIIHGKIFIYNIP